MLKGSTVVAELGLVSLSGHWIGGVVSIAVIVASLDSRFAVVVPALLAAQTVLSYLEDDGYALDCACLTIANALHCLDGLSSAPLRLFHGEIGSRSSLCDSAMGFVREKATRYRLRSLATVFVTIDIFLMLVLGEALTASGLRRFVALSQWQNVYIRTILVTQMACFDRSAVEPSRVKRAVRLRAVPLLAGWKRDRRQKDF